MRLEKGSRFEMSFTLFFLVVGLFHRMFIKFEPGSVDVKGIDR